MSAPSQRGSIVDDGVHGDGMVRRHAGVVGWGVGGYGPAGQRRRPVRVGGYGRGARAVGNNHTLPPKNLESRGCAGPSECVQPPTRPSRSSLSRPIAGAKADRVKHAGRSARRRQVGKAALHRRPPPWRDAGRRAQAGAASVERRSARAPEALPRRMEGSSPGQRRARRGSRSQAWADRADDHARGRRRRGSSRSS